MNDLLGDAAVQWTALVAIGYPLIAALTVELKRQSASRLPALSRILGQLQLSVIPLTAVYLLMRRVGQLPSDGVALKMVETALAIATINTLLYGMNAIMRSEAVSGGAANRVPGLLLDILRIFLVLVASAFVASEIWTVDLGSLLAALGVGSVVLGLALQDTLSGLFAGVSLLSGRQFKEGDWIEFGDASGKIVKMDWRSVTVETLDDERLMVIPNSALSSGIFTILSSASRTFGQNLNVTFSYESPPARVMEAIEQAILSVDLILSDPPYDIDLMETSDQGIIYEVTIHTATRGEGEEAATLFFRRLWYISAREGLQFAGSVNRKYRGAGVPALARPDIARALAATSIFLPSAVGFDELADSAAVCLFDDGERLLSTGQPFNRMYLVVAGNLLVTRDELGRGRTLQRVVPGEFFVSRAFLTAAPASTSLIADGEVMSISLDTLRVTEFLNKNPRLARLFEAAIDSSESGLSMSGSALR